jgi:hypothetical protein
MQKIRLETEITRSIEKTNKEVKDKKRLLL